MLPNEREMLADQAVSRMSRVIGSGNFGLFADALKHKFILLLSTMDRAVEASNRPVLITELVPGYDMLVARSMVAQHNDVVPKSGTDVRALTPIDPAILACLTHVLDQEFEPAHGKGALLYASDDGTHYVAFQSKNRSMALESMGISADELLAVPGEVEKRTLQ